MQYWKQCLGDINFANLPQDVPYEEGFEAVPRQHRIIFEDVITNQVAKQPYPPIKVLGTALIVLMSRLLSAEDVAVGVCISDGRYIVIRLPNVNVKEDTFEMLLYTFSESLEKNLANWQPLESIIKLIDEDSQLPYVNRSIFSICIYDCGAELSAEAQLNICDLSMVVEPNGLLIRYNAVMYSSKRVEVLGEQYACFLRNLTSVEGSKVPAGEFSLVTDICNSVIPDPTEDLNFNMHEPLITDKFSLNAETHPDRLCVRETEPGVDYLYKDINYATNLLANYLQNANLARGDVIGIYSYRGVGLVVAIIGALKAGLVYFIIDPAYPPTRQIMYIRSAKPKALIFLSQAGDISGEVSEYVDSELGCNLLQIFNLEISGATKQLRAYTKVNAKLSSINFDQFDKIRAPSPRLGPDTLATLSFTSGSTGVPKGVLGRHYSLIFLYPFMAEKYNIGQNDRFTMLSGISHDPIQRDIFTPLYLGGSLFVPSATDIAVPGRLAQWALENKVSVTVLTPAMGQLLTSNTGHIVVPSLKNAFFVGDFLFKGIAEKLRSLCPNVDIINMYGTTETQRSCAYYYIPSRCKVASGLCSDSLTHIKSTIPLGVGMKDVQILIINKFNRMCGVGELGEVYMRSYGLAEGYLDDLNSSEKFMDNWFVDSSHSSNSKDNITIKYEDNYYKGRRDRMYKTGDLGFYRTDKTVECVGRVDDQIKIRGFRIELKEIYVCMLSSPLVSETAVILKNDKDVGKYLVGYFTPSPSANLNSPEKLSNAARTIREYLKNKLPSYGVPRFIVPISHIPLTPNNKVDKKNLPDPILTMSALEKSTHKGQDANNQFNGKICEASSAKKFITIVANVLGLPESQIHPDSNFFDLGGHSILATKLHYHISKEMKTDINLQVIYSSKSLSDILNSIESQSAAHSKNQEGSVSDVVPDSHSYAADFHVLNELLSEIINSNTNSKAYEFKDLYTKPSKIFLTGATGYLGSFILGSILSRFPHATIIVLVRTHDVGSGLERIRSSLRRNPLHDSKWIASSLSRVRIVCGNQFEKRLGLSAAQWDVLCDEIDVIIHNGALVHWLYPYEKLRSPNTLSTLDMIDMACSKRVKSMLFVSSTAVFDTSEYLAASSAAPIREDDSLERGSLHLKTGYARSKWVSEKLVLSARSKGLPFMIIRPGYILGDSASGVINTDDFLWRLAVGCVELGHYPKLPYHINAYPVDHVAELITSIISYGDGIDLGVYNVWNEEDFSFESIFDALCDYYDLQELEYNTWKEKFEDIVANDEKNKLYPFLQLIFTDLPTSIQSPRLDTSNTKKVLRDHPLSKIKISNLVHIFIGYMCRFNYIKSPLARSELGRHSPPAGNAPKGRRIAVPPSLKQWENAHSAGAFHRSTV